MFPYLQYLLVRFLFWPKWNIVCFHFYIIFFIRGYIVLVLEVFVGFLLGILVGYETYSFTGTTCRFSGQGSGLWLFSFPLLRVSIGLDWSVTSLYVHQCLLLQEVELVLLLCHCFLSSLLQYHCHLLQLVLILYHCFLLPLILYHCHLLQLVLLLYCCFLLPLLPYFFNLLHDLLVFLLHPLWVFLLL